jgi:formamidopyrimidine-DNA glycosylase
MPELPEVETIRRQLEPEVVGKRLVEVQVLDPLWTAPMTPEAVADTCSTGVVTALDRRGKYLILALDHDSRLVMHLRMTGNLLVSTGRPAGPHLRARIRLAPGPDLDFVDTRRFGRGLAFPDGAAADAYLDSRLGVEPLSGEFTPEVLTELATGRVAPLKSFLLRQDRIAGIGNIYADEALHRAEIHPLSPAGALRGDHSVRLHAGILGALRAGIDFGGASIDDYRDARGEPGRAHDEFLVHRREGEPCPRCGTAVRRIRVGGRSTYFCPRCQRRLRRRAPAMRRRAPRES